MYTIYIKKEKRLTVIFLYQETGEQEEFAHVTAADSLPKEGSEIPREQDQDYPSAL